MSAIISINTLSKTYANGFQALNNVSLDIEAGEIFALLGPNGAGKTTLISIICGISPQTNGTISVGGFDTLSQYRETRQQIGLVPQELTLQMFESVWDTVTFSRGLFNLPPNPDYIERLLKALSLWEKKDNKLMTLSGGMKRRVLIAKALAHEPKILFLDEPTAGVDVELRKDMWKQVRDLRKTGVTIILTTHYIEEAEEMADRIGVINKGKLLLVEDKQALIKKMGQKQLYIELNQPLETIPSSLNAFDLKLEGNQLVLTYDSKSEHHDICGFFDQLHQENIRYLDLKTRQSSLEEIFVQLVNRS